MYFPLTQSHFLLLKLMLPGYWSRARRAGNTTDSSPPAYVSLPNQHLGKSQTCPQVQTGPAQSPFPSTLHMAPTDLLCLQLLSTVLTLSYPT